jgi:hypothetical protein
MLSVFCCAWWIGTSAFGLPHALAAQWLAPAASDHITAEWVKHIEADLSSKPFNQVFMGMPADSPIPAVLHLLNNAAHALANDNKQYAQLFVNDAIRVLDNGVTKGWYSATDIDPVKAMIQQRANAAFEGKSVNSTANPRWTGYSANKPLGLTNARGEKQDASAEEEAAAPNGTSMKQ